MDFLIKIRKQIEALVERVPARKIDLALAIIVTLAGLTVYAFVEIGKNTSAVFSFINNVESRSLDARFRMRGPRPHDDRIVIVDIDEKTLQRVGAWPIPRSAYANLVDKLTADGVKVMAFDVDFPTPEKNSAVEALKKLEEELGPKISKDVIEKIKAIEGTSDNDVLLAASMKKSGRVVLGHLFLDEERSRSQTDQTAEEYFKVLWDKPFPQLVPAKGSNGKDINPAETWKKQGGKTFVAVEPNMSLLADAAASYGFFNYEPDGDGTMRHATLLIEFINKDNVNYFFACLPFQTLKLMEDIKEQSTVGYIAENGLESLELGPYKFNTRSDGTVLINFSGPYQTYQHYSMTDVIDGTLPASTFKDKIVFLGATALGIGDMRITPFEGWKRIVKETTGKDVMETTPPYMGVELHANVLDNMMHNSEHGRGFLSHGFNEEMIDIIFILTFGMGLGFLFGRLKPFHSTIVAILALLLFAIVVFLAFSWMGMWLSFVIPAGTMVVDYAAITSFRMIFEEREKRKIRNYFSSYVSPGVIALIEKDPRKYLRSGGEMKDLTIMFSDIRSFTTIAEGLTPDELVHLLNEYLGEMTDILFKNRGTLDKYIGDAIMAFWGSPFPQTDHAILGCNAALDMGNRLDELNMKWEAAGRKQLNIGIGLNTGPVNVGNMGSAKRWGWTVMGDNVNLSSRLEGQTKDYRIRIIAGDGTYMQAKEHFVFRDLDKIKVKGKLKPVNIYELLAHGKNASSYVELLSKWNTAIGLYRAGRWNSAKDKFEELLQRWPDDGPAHTFLKRCHEKIEEAVPEGDWDGVWVAKTK